MQEIAQASYLLPAYEAQRVSLGVKQLKEQLYRARDQAMPKKKFAFSKASKLKSESVPVMAGTGHQHDEKLVQKSTTPLDHALVLGPDMQDR